MRPRWVLTLKHALRIADLPLNKQALEEDAMLLHSAAFARQRVESKAEEEQ